MTTALGYASSSDGSVHFGFGKADKIDRIEIVWPSGAHQVLQNVKPDQVLTVRESSSAGENGGRR